MLFTRVFSLFTLLVVLSQCTLESATAPERRELVIASDYLQEKDTVLFADFERRKKIHVRIVSLDAEVIYSQLREQQANTGIDLLLLESEHDVQQLAVNDLLQPFTFEPHYAKTEMKHVSERYQYVGFALDPFVITTPKSNGNIQTYNDLTRQPFINELSSSDQITLLAPICRKMEKGKAQSWLHQYAEQRLSTSSRLDSVGLEIPVLLKRSSYLAQKDTSKQKDHPNMRILSSGSFGSFYNLRTMCLTVQCEHYTEAQEFIAFHLLPWRNKALCKRMYVVPVYGTGKVFRPYKLRTEELLPYHTMVARILERLGIN